MFRRKFRTILTIFGIVIGIYAFSIMGAMSEKMNLLIDGGIRFISGQVLVSAKGGSVGGPFSTALLEKETIEKIEKIEGVKATQRRIIMMLDETGGELNIGMPRFLEGWEQGTGFKSSNNMKIKIGKGRDVKKGDSKTALVGHDIAKDKKLDIGDTIKIRGTNFKVVGVTEKMLTAPDSIVWVPMKDARILYVDSQPFLKNLEKKSNEAKSIDNKTMSLLPERERKALFATRDFNVQDANNSLAVSWKKGTDPEKLAKRIQKEVDGVYTVSPKSGAESFRNASAVINLIIMGSALIAVVVGGLAVINTMIMAVNERTKEIGIKRAVGAKTRNILSDYLMEAALIGLFGGLIGLGLAAVTVQVINAKTMEGGVEIFAMTRRLALTSLSFALILGIMAGIYPAIHASRLNPVKALRDQ